MPRGNRLYGWEDRLINGFIALITAMAGNDPVRSGKREKFVGYRDLLRVLETHECPICFIVKRSLQGVVNIEFVEELTIPEFREPLRMSWGYCREHSQLTRAAAGKRLRSMGVAIVYEDILTLVQQQIRETGVLTIPSGCPLCKLQADAESYALRLVADYCDDGDFQARYKTSAGACLVHLRDLLGMANGDAKEFLIKSHEEMLERLITSLEGFIRKHDYRFLGEKLSEREASSWNDAIHFVVGT